MKSLLTIFALLLTTLNFSQTMTGSELLDKAIQYHDPNSKWPTFNGRLNVTMEIPNSPKRVSTIDINLPDEYFNVVAKRDTVVTTHTLNKGKCLIASVDSLRIANQKETPRRSHCETTTLYKNYYTYLYGLPMKLKDPGTNIHNTVERKIFKDKDYLVLKATYEEAVGNDVWYFYFDSETYAMEVYQFFKTDANGKMKPDSGEYILLTEEVSVNGIKLPKNRAWYYNKDDKYLGTDILKD